MFLLLDVSIIHAIDVQQVKVDHLYHQPTTCHSKFVYLPVAGLDIGRSIIRTWHPLVDLLPAVVGRKTAWDAMASK